MIIIIIVKDEKSIEIVRNYFATPYVVDVIAYSKDLNLILFNHGSNNSNNNSNMNNNNISFKNDYFLHFN